MQEATRRIRDAIRQRYILLPYIYTLFRHANTSGTPVMRPLWFDFPEEAATFAVDDEFMLGPGLLVSPCCKHLPVSWRPLFKCRAGKPLSNLCTVYWHADIS